MKRVADNLNGRITCILDETSGLDEALAANKFGLQCFWNRCGREISILFSLLLVELRIWLRDL